MNLKNKFEKIKKNRDINNVIFSLLSYLIIPIGTLVSTPLLIKYLGLEEYGYWILLNSIIAIMGISNFGIGNSIIKFGSKYLSAKDSNNFNKVISTTLLLSFVISSVLILIGILIDLYFTGYITFMQDINVSMSVLTIIVSLKIVSSIYSSIIMAHQRYDVTNKINILINLSLILFTTILAIYTSDIRNLIYALLCITSIASIIFYFKAKKIFQDMKLSIKFYRDTFKETINYGIFSWMQTIISTAYNQVDKIIVSVLLGPQLLGVYTACLQLAQKIHEIPTAAGAFLLPKFSAKADGEKRSIKVTYINSSILVILTTFLISLPLMVFAEEILNIWLGTDFSNKYAHLLKVLVISISSGTLFIVPFYLLNGLGYVRINTLVNAVLSLTSVLSTMILIPYLGIFGAAYGRLMGLPIILIVITFLEMRIFKEIFYYRIMLFLSFLQVLFILVVFLFINYVELSNDFLIVICIITITLLHSLYSIPIFNFIKKRF